MNSVAQIEQHRDFVSYLENQRFRELQTTLPSKSQFHLVLLYSCQIADTFSTGFEMLCIIDEVLRASNSAGIAQDDLTDVQAHFIDDNQPVPIEVIEAYVFYLSTILLIFGYLSPVSSEV